MSFIDELEMLEERVDEAKAEIRSLLCRYGWVYTCSSPGSYWYWQKRLPDGRTLLVDEKLAVLIESELQYWRDG